LHREYRMICHVLRGDFSRDLYERRMHISHENHVTGTIFRKRLEQVHDEVIEQYFSRFDDPRWEDLNLPTRCSHGRNIESKLWLKSWTNSSMEPWYVVVRITHHLKFE
ncbi:hypothetical protein BAE44_0013274, partial [Dichanthelium oligosanthes]